MIKRCLSVAWIALCKHTWNLATAWGDNKWSKISAFSIRMSFSFLLTNLQLKIAVKEKNLSHARRVLALNLNSVSPALAIRLTNSRPSVKWEKSRSRPAVNTSLSWSDLIGREVNQILRSGDCQSNSMLISTLYRRRKFMQVRKEKKKTSLNVIFLWSWEVAVTRRRETASERDRVCGI